MKILIFGHVGIDENISENSSYTYWGSPAMYIAKILGLFKDIEIEIVSNYGADFEPYKVGIKFFPTSAKYAKTLLYHNDSRGKIRKQRVLNRRNSSLVTLIPDLQNKIKNADIIFFAPLLFNFPVSYIKDISNISKNALKVLLPQGYFREYDSYKYVIPRCFKEINEFKKFIDIIIVSDQEEKNIKENVKNWVKGNSLVTIVTCGKDGAELYKDGVVNQFKTIPIPKEKVIDSVGCGDIFSAGFAYKYFKTKNLVESVEFANKLAGKSLFYTPQNINQMEIGDIEA